MKREAITGSGRARDRFWFRPGRGRDGELPPNDWQSFFGGPAWTRGPDGQWYLHMFTPEQPDLNGEHAEVRAEFEDILRFWLDRGVDGFRVDVAHGLMKQPGLPDVGADPDPADLPYQDCDGVHEIYRSWRRAGRRRLRHQPMPFGRCWCQRCSPSPSLQQWGLRRRP
jgi:alpha-glucosidase